MRERSPRPQKRKERQNKVQSVLNITLRLKSSRKRTLRALTVLNHSVCGCLIVFGVVFFLCLTKVYYLLLGRTVFVFSCIYEYV